MKRALSLFTAACLAVGSITFVNEKVFADDSALRYSDSATLRFSENFENYIQNPTFTHAVNGYDSKGNSSLSTVPSGIDKNTTKVGMLDEPTFYSSDTTLTRHTDSGEIDSTARQVAMQYESEYVRLDEDFKDADHIRLKFKYYAAQHARKNGTGARDTLQIGFSANTTRFSSNNLYASIQNTALRINADSSATLSAKVKEWTEVEMDVRITGRGQGVNGTNIAEITVKTLGATKTYTTEKAGNAAFLLMNIDHANGGRFYVDDIEVYTVEDFPQELTQAAESLEFSQTSNGQLANGVSENLTMLDSAGDYRVEWSSSNPKCLTNDGVVTRRSFEQKTMLTARVIASEKVYIEKDFEVTVVPTAGASDEDVLREYAEAYLTEADFTDEPPEAVTENLKTLPTAHEASGAMIEWASDNSAIANDGTVTRPGYDSEDAEVTLTATLTRNSAQITKDLHFKVLKLLNPHTVIDADMELITAESLTDSEEPDEITLNLKLPSNGANGSTITWTSDTPGCIANDGTVVRGASVVTVTMTAAFTYGAVTKEKQYVFKVIPSVEKMIEADIAAIDTSDWDKLTENFELPTEGAVYGSEFKWSSSSEHIEIKGENALVYRPVYEKGDQNVVLTLYVTNSNQIVVKTFDTKVLCKVSDADAVQAAKDLLTFESISIDRAEDVNRNLSLIDKIGDGVSVSWSSSDESVVSSTTGEVCKPNPSESDASVTLTATLTKNYAIDTKTFTFTVKMFENEYKLLESASDTLLFSALTDEEIDAVTHDLTLPQTWRYGTSVSWSSSNAAVNVSGDRGIVIRPEWGVTSVQAELTAVISYGQSSITKTFSIGVLEKDYMEVTEHVWDENFDDWGMTDSNGRWNIPETDAEGTVYLSTDPLDADNSVLKYDKYDAAVGTGYVRYQSNAANGGIAVTQLRVYIEPEIREGKNQHWINIENITLNGSQAAIALQPKSGQIRVNADVDGTLTSLVTNAMTVSVGEWYTIRFECNTALKTYNVYVNDELITGNGMLKNASSGTPYDSTLGVAYTYTYDPSRPTAISGFRFSMEAGGVAYIDDMSIDKKLVYTEKQKNVSNAWEREFLMKNNIHALSRDLYLPKSTDSAITIAYSSSNVSTVSTAGTVTPTSEPKQVLFTVSFIDDETSYNRQYILTVGKNTGKSDAECAADDLKEVMDNIRASYLLENLKTDITIPKLGENGSVITAQSSDTTVLSDSGAVTRGAKSSTVTLTLTATKNDESKTGSLSITVAAKETSQGSQTSGVSSPKVSTVFGKGTIAQSGIDLDQPEKGNEDQNKSEFADVERDFWAYSDIKYLVDKKIMSGNGNNNIEPLRNVLREEFIKLLLGSMDETPIQAEKVFEDVDTDEWYAPYITAAKEKNLISGYDNGRVGIGENITRQDMAVMIYRAARLAAIEENALFDDDAEIDGYARSAVYTLKDLGIINGKENNCFDAKANATRAEAAKILASAIKKGLFD